MSEIKDFYGKWTVLLSEPGEEPVPLLDARDTLTISADATGATRVSAVESPNNRPGRTILRQRRWQYKRVSKFIESEFDLGGHTHIIKMKRGIADQDAVNKGKASAVGNKILTIEIDPHDGAKRKIAFGLRTHKGTYHAEG